jgi:hypothetical protein
VPQRRRRSGSSLRSILPGLCRRVIARIAHAVFSRAILGLAVRIAAALICAGAIRVQERGALVFARVLLGRAEGAAGGPRRGGRRRARALQHEVVQVEAHRRRREALQRWTCTGF